MAILKVTNISGSTVRVEGFPIAPGEDVEVINYTPSLEKLKNDGLVTVTAVNTEGGSGGGGQTDGLTNTQLRATPVPVAVTFPSTQAVSGPATDAQLRATPLPVAVTFPATQPVSGPLTDTQLRATPVSVTTGGLTDTQLRAAPLTVTTGGLTDVQLRATPVSVTVSNLPASINTVPDNTSAGLPVRQVGQDITITSFSDVGSGVLTPNMVQIRSGAGFAISQSASNLVIATGTTANSDFLARSILAWRGAWITKMKTILSQRIANQNFLVMMADLFAENAAFTINSATSVSVTKVAHGLTANSIGQFMFIGGSSLATAVPGRYAIASIPDADTITFTVAGWPASGTGTLTLFGRSHVKVAYSGTTATAATFDAQRNGWATGDTTLTVNTTASPGHVINIHNDGSQCFVGDTLSASTLTPNVVVRGTRIENIPNDNIDLYLFIWSYNGTAAPASTTTWTIGYWGVEKFANNPVYIAGSRMQGNAPPLPVMITPGANTIGSVTLNAGSTLVGDVSVQYRAGSTGAASGTHIISAASTNSTIIKASTGKIVGWCLTNTTASFKYVKFHNIATAPTAGSGVVRTIGLAPNSTSVFSIDGGIGFATGIGMTITGAFADADATAVAVGDVVGDIFFA